MIFMLFKIYILDLKNNSVSFLNTESQACVKVLAKGSQAEAGGSGPGSQRCWRG